MYIKMQMIFFLRLSLLFFVNFQSRPRLSLFRLLKYPAPDVIRCEMRGLKPGRMRPKEATRGTREVGCRSLRCLRGFRGLDEGPNPFVSTTRRVHFVLHGHICGQPDLTYILLCYWRTDSMRVDCECARRALPRLGLVKFVVSPSCLHWPSIVWYRVCSL